MSNTIEKLIVSEEEMRQAVEEFLKVEIDKDASDALVLSPESPGLKDRAIDAIAICVPDAATATEAAATFCYLVSGALNITAYAAWGAYKGTELLAKGSKKAAKSLQKSSERQREQKH